MEAAQHEAVHRRGTLHDIAFAERIRRETKAGEQVGFTGGQEIEAT